MIKIIFILAFILNTFGLYSQSDSLRIIAKDSLSKFVTDSTKLKKPSSTGIDTTIFYTSRDTVTLNLKSKIMKLRGTSKLNYKTQNLDAENIDIDFNSSIMEAYGSKIENKSFGFPKFKESGTDYVGEKIKFNFKTNKGIIKFGETELSNGFFFGDKIKRVSQNELFIKNGYYTTCSAPHPHYYFGSPQMKLIAQDKIFLDPIIFYVEDLPIFALPIGLYFPTSSGRKSGLIVPTYGVTKNRGVIYENLGFYWAASEYFDSQLTASIYTKGGYLFKNHSNWVLKDVYNGSIDLSYGKTRFNPEEQFSDAYKIRFNHDHILSPTDRITSNMDFSSANFNQNTSSNINERVKQSITSNASYSSNWDNGNSLSIAYSREQNIINNSYRQGLTTNFNVPNIKIAQIFEKDFVISGRLNWNLNFDKSYDIVNTRYLDNSSRIDTGFTKTQKNFIAISPNFSYSFPKIWMFNVTPSYSINGNLFFRRISNRTYDTLNSRFNDSYEYGVFPEYWYNYGVSLTTRFYGMAKPKVFGINAIRHTVEPSFGYRFDPNFSDNNNYYSTYIDEKQKKSFSYSRFINEGGSHSSQSKGQSLTYGFRNRVEMKIAQGDTIADKNLELLQLDFNGAYNFVLDSFKMSPLSVSFRTPAVPLVNFGGSANFKFYDEISEQTSSGNYKNRNINKTLLESGKGLLRLTDINFNIGTSFNNQGIGTAPNNQTNQPSKRDSSELGERFRQRLDYSYQEPDYFGENSPGYSDIQIPWNLNVSANFSYSQPLLDYITRSFSILTDFTFSLTKTWKVGANAGYDIVNSRLTSTSVNISKDLDCYDLTFRWYPIGNSQGFYLRFGIKASQLKDLMYEKQSNPIYR